MSRIQVLVKKINQTCDEIRNIKKLRNKPPLETIPHKSLQNQEMTFNSLLTQRQLTMDNDIIHRNHNNAETGQRPLGQPSPTQLGPSPLGTLSSSSTRTPLPSSSLADWDLRAGITDMKEVGEEQGSLSSSSSSSELDPYWAAMEAKELPNPASNEGLLWKKQGGDGGQRTDEGMELIPSHSWRKSRAETSESTFELGKQLVPTAISHDPKTATFRQVDGLDSLLHKVVMLGEEVREVLEESEVGG